MTVNRDTYLKPFKQKIELQCPHCDNGVLETVDETFKTIPTASQEFFREINEDRFECWDGKFITFLKCGNKKCKDIVVVTGIIMIDEVPHRCHEECFLDHLDSPIEMYDYVSYQQIKYIDPPINIIKIYKDVPVSVNNVIVESFSLFWSHPSSAGNEIRKAIELIMDEKEVKTMGVDKNGKECELSLHKRIEEFGKIEKGKYFGESLKLLDIKWLGNAGSHKGELIEKEDILDAYDVLEHVLDEIFVREKRVADAKIKSAKLNKKFSRKK